MDEAAAIEWAGVAGFLACALLGEYILGLFLAIDGDIDRAETLLVKLALFVAREFEVRVVSDFYKLLNLRGLHHSSSKCSNKCAHFVNFVDFCLKFSFIKIFYHAWLFIP